VRVRDVDGEAGMRIRLALTLDVHRDQSWTAPTDPEHAPEVTVKGSAILDRRPAEDYDDTRLPPEPRLGFQRQEPR
jgi:hypothetical protein